MRYSYLRHLNLGACSWPAPQCARPRSLAYKPISYFRGQSALLQLAQGCPDPAAPLGSAYWGAPAAHTRTGEVVGAAESDPLQPPSVHCSSQGVVIPESATVGSGRFGESTCPIR